MVVKAKDSPLVAGNAQPAAADGTVRMRALSRFRLPGREDPAPGDVIDVPKALAAELVMYGRVEPVADKEN